MGDNNAKTGNMFDFITTNVKNCDNVFQALN